MSGSMRRGFRRLTFVLWGTGLIVLVLFVGALGEVNPFYNVCMGNYAYRYDDCLRPEEKQKDRAIPREEADSVDREMDQQRAAKLWAAIGKSDEQIEEELRRDRVDSSRFLPRHRTEDYRERIAVSAGLLIAWTLAVWGLFLVMSWVVLGFRGTGNGTS